MTDQATDPLAARLAEVKARSGARVPVDGPVPVTDPFVRVLMESAADVPVLVACPAGRGGKVSEPTMTCKLCGRSLVVQPDGRGFPPDITKRKLRKLCAAAGCLCEPSYRAGMDPGLAALLAEGSDRG